MSNNRTRLNDNLTEHMVEYLQIIQEPICRMSTASAIFKGFAATIVSGIAALSYPDINKWVLVLSFIPVFSFCVLDIYYLHIEKKYRYMYNQVANKNHSVDFSMDISSINPKDAKATILDCIKSPSIYLFYPTMVLILICVLIGKFKGAI
ncbi:MAG: hypothetical protein VZR27_05780 [Acutalibacteraceae bacterium]|nr:hypothetical protein [Acutalibacteraceae bacterium]